MTDRNSILRLRDTDQCRNQSGFGLVEFLISTLILLVSMCSIFALLAEIQSKAGYQSEVHAVLDNSRLAMQTVGRYLRQAGNDPNGQGIPGITIAGPSAVVVRSDLTGSAAPGDPDKGDPDGDTLDSGENVTIRYNARTRSLEVLVGNSAQVVAGYLSGLSFQYYNSEGVPATSGSDVRSVKVTVSGASLTPDPDTYRRFGVRLISEFCVAR